MCIWHDIQIWILIGSGWQVFYAYLLLIIRNNVITIIKIKQIEKCGE